MEEALGAIWNSSFIGAIILTIALILVGYLFTKYNFFKNNPSQIFSTLAMKVCLPCLAFVGFMSDLDLSQIGIFIVSFVGFAVLFLIGRLFFIKVNKDDFDLCRTSFALGQVSLFGLPLAKAIYGDSTLSTANMVLLSFRLFLYIYAYFLISRIEVNKDSLKDALKRTFVTPIMIAMLIGFIFYISQLFMPKVYVGEELVSVLRVDKTLSHLYYPIKVIGDLSVPVSMLLVGSSLASIDLKTALKNRLAWFTSFLRSFAAPFVVICLLFLYQLIFKSNNSLLLTKESVIIIVLLFASPTSVTVNTMVVQNNRNSVLTSDCVFLSTILSLISYPVLLIICELIF